MAKKKRLKVVATPPVVPTERDLKIAAITDAAAPEKEADLWKSHVAALAKAVDDRHADAVERLKTEVVRLDNEMSALVNRRELVAQTEEAEQLRREATCAAELQDFLARHGKDEAALVARRERLGQIIEQRMSRLGGEIKRLHARMKQIAKLLRQAEMPKGAARTDGPTAEASLQPASRDIVGLLEGMAKGGITHQQAEAARQIAEINEAISAAGKVKATNLAGAGGGVVGPFRDIVIAGKLDEKRSRKYLPWADALVAQSRAAGEARPVTLDIVVKVAVYNVGVEALARHHHIRREKVIQRLRDGLDAFVNQPWVKPRGQALSVAQLDS